MGQGEIGASGVPGNDERLKRTPVVRGNEHGDPKVYAG